MLSNSEIQMSAEMIRSFFVVIPPIQNRCVYGVLQMVEYDDVNKGEMQCKVVCHRQSS